MNYVYAEMSTSDEFIQLPSVVSPILHSKTGLVIVNKNGW